MSTQTQNGNKPGMGILGPVRLSYLNVFKPRKNDMREGEMEYSVVLLIPKLPTEHCKDPKAVGKRASELIKEALAAKFGTEPGKWETCLKDGDVETDGEGKPKNPGYWFIPARCGTEYPPMLIDGARNVVSGGWQSGDWGNVKVSFFGYEFKGKRGVSAGLRAVQFLYHDEPFGGGGTSPDEFPEVAGAHASEPHSEAASASDYDPFADQ